MSGGGAIGSEELPPPPHEDNKITPHNAKYVFLIFIS